MADLVLWCFSWKQENLSHQVSEDCDPVTVDPTKVEELPGLRAKADLDMCL